MTDSDGATFPAYLWQCSAAKTSLPTNQVATLVWHREMQKKKIIKYIWEGLFKLKFLTPNMTLIPFLASVCGAAMVSGAPSPPAPVPAATSHFQLFKATDTVPNHDIHNAQTTASDGVVSVSCTDFLLSVFFLATP
jgi:hypothetical protein